MAIETLEAPQANLSGVARILVRAGRIEPRVAEELTRQAREKKTSFVVVEMELNVPAPPPESVFQNSDPLPHDVLPDRCPDPAVVLLMSQYTLAACAS